MKKVLMAVALFTALCFGYNKLNAQTATGFKVGVFDLDIMVQVMPEYRVADSLTQIYNRDTLGAEYQVYMSEYQRLDSTLKADTAKGNVAKTVMDYNNQQKQQMATQLMYWQQIAQQKSQDYQRQLLAPTYKKVLAAYKKVLAAKKYDLILKPDAYEVGSKLENMFPFVAKELGVTLPQGLTVDPNQALNDPSLGGAAGAAKP
ncbi:OmpH family outer membrane protein [Parafilimonas terrae]|jgi:Skp family chaperone for outer membrane proteins|uniref:Periplasmic chaperone for outer membrane proteins Skp n=1 Tax=Parafilimonas terrae TaxID=1465490 RepID=A0A1I5WWL8_9BACT|nr:OmpH family outer membrane protein [Parafilimonas terrae]SFQ24094.1 periplasmic chaperone for outer membrane proteins Skp [Parafilimonas terrae]